MNTLLSFAGLVLFGISALYIGRVDWRDDNRDRQLAWVFGSASVLLVATAALVVGDYGSIIRAATAAAVLGAVPLLARFLYPDGIDLLDSVVTAFVGFTVGLVSWELAWRATVVAAAIAGLIAAVDLLRHDDRRRRIPYGAILVGVGVVVTGFAL